QATAVEQRQRPGKGGIRTAPGAGTGGTVRTASQTGAITRLRGQGGMFKVLDILFQRRNYRTHRATEDACGLDGDKKQTIKPGIAGQSGALVINRGKYSHEPMPLPVILSILTILTRHTRHFRH